MLDPDVARRRERLAHHGRGRDARRGGAAAGASRDRSHSGKNRFVEGVRAPRVNMNTEHDICELRRNGVKPRTEWEFGNARCRTRTGFRQPGRGAAHRPGARGPRAERLRRATRGTIRFPSPAPPASRVRASRILLVLHSGHSATSEARRDRTHGHGVASESPSPVYQQAKVGATTAWRCLHPRDTSIAGPGSWSCNYS